MSIVLLGATSGSVTLAEPAVGGSTIINIPAASGTMASLASVTNNGVAYVNSSGQPTSGSALSFNGSALAITGAMNATASTGTTSILRQNSATGYGLTIIPGADSTYDAFTINNAADSLNKIRMYGNGSAYFAGNLSIGGATLTTSGSGITFPATQSASTNANTLDDYEEGTWAPSVGGNATYYAQAGTYVKIGRFVYVDFLIRVNVLGTGSTSIIANLPFTAGAGGSPRSSGSISYAAALAVSVYSLSLNFDGNGIQCIGFTGLSSGVLDSAAVFGNSTYIIGSGHYYTSA